jgi:broad specificity phosphatase PhoE
MGKQASLMTGRIITARHGRPDLSRDLAITAKDYGAWWARYDACGLAPEECAPERLVQLAKNAATVLSSTLPRAMETAAIAIEGAREAPADPMFVEAPLPPPPIPWLKLRPGAWGVLSRTLWFLGYAPGDVENHFQAWSRVRRIAARLSDCARKGDVVLFAHGYLNWMIDQQLRRESWVRSECDGGNRYWSWRVYEPAGLRETVKPAAAPEQASMRR